MPKNVLDNIKYAAYYQIANKREPNRMNKIINNKNLSTESKKINYSNSNYKNKDNIKLDSNGEEIIWEFRKKLNLLNVVWSYGIIIAFLSLVASIAIFLPFKYDWNVKTSIICLFGLVGIGAFFMNEIYPTFNIKTLYATKDDLVIKRFLNGDIRIPLGNFIIRLNGFPTPVVLDSIGLFAYVHIVHFLNQKTLYNFLLPTLYPLKNTNFSALEQIIAPKITLCLTNLDKENYEKCKKDLKWHPEVIGSNIDYAKIDKLREKQANND